MKFHYSVPLIILFLTTILSAAVNTWEEVTPSFVPPAVSPDARLHGYNSWANTQPCKRRNAIIAWRLVTDSVRLHSIYANGIVLWNLQDNEIACHTVSHYGGGTYRSTPSFYLLPEFANDTTPSPRHPYDGLTYVDSLDAVYMMMGAQVRINNYGNNTDPDLNGAFDLDLQSTWKYSFKDNKWYRIPENIRKFWGQYTASQYESKLFYWPSAHKLVWVDDKGRHHAEFDLNTEVWTEIITQNNAPFTTYSHGRSTWDTKRELLYYRRHDSLGVYDPAQKRHTLLPNCPIRGYGITYIPKWDICMAIGDSTSKTAIYDIQVSTWSILNCNVFDFPSYRYSYITYDESTDLVGLSTANSTDFYTMQYVPDDTTRRERVAPGGDVDIIVGPNPFYAWTTMNIEYRMSNVECRSVELSIFNLKGQLIEKNSFNIRNSLNWNASVYPPGIYFLSAKIGNKTIQKKLIHLQ